MLRFLVLLMLSNSGPCFITRFRKFNADREGRTTEDETA